MSISALQQEAFNNSPSFRGQVNSVVKEQTLLKSDPNDTSGSYLLAQVLRNPESYGFPATLIADATWDVTYDVWANDPKSADFLILSGVQKWYNLLTGYIPPAPAPQTAPPPEGTPTP